MPIARVRTVFSGPAGTPWLGTAYFDFPALTDPDPLVAAVGTFWAVADAGMDSSVSWSTEAEVPVIDEVNGDILSVETTTPISGVGSQAGEMAPTLLQGLVSWRTGVFVDGREVRGRWFIPGLSEIVLADGVLESTYRTDLTNAAAAYIVTPGISPVIWQRPRLADASHVPPITARDGSQHPISAGSATNRFSMLRSRRD